MVVPFLLGLASPIDPRRRRWPGASLCRALIHEPKMLLLDEPFGPVDAPPREELWCILRDLWTEQGFNVILVTHDLRESLFLADTFT